MSELSIIANQLSALKRFVFFLGIDTNDLGTAPFEDADETHDDINNLYPVEDSPKIKGIRLLSWNVRSLGIKLDKCKDLILDLAPDVACIQEVWQIPPNIDINIPGYHPPFTNLRKKSRGGGILTYVRDSLPATHTTDFFEERGLETQTIKITIRKKLYTFINVYFAQFNKMQQISSLKKIIHKVKSKQNLFILGDFNINLARIGRDSDADFLLDTLHSYNLFPQAYFPTRSQPVHGVPSNSTIDNIFAPINLPGSSSCFGITATISDHFPVVFDWGQKIKHKKLTKIISTATPRDHFNLEMAFTTQDWSPVYNCISFEDKVECFELIKDSLIQKFLPTKQITFDPLKNKPWFTAGFRVSRHTLQKLKRRSVTSGARMAIFLNYKTHYNKLLKIASQSAFFEQCSQARTDSRKLWQLLDQKLNRKKKATSPASVFMINDELENDKKKISNAFNEHYTTVGPKLAQKFTGPQDIEQYLTKTDSVFSFHDVSHADTRRIIKRMANKKSHGHDLLTNSILKANNYSLSKPLTHIINQSLILKTFPKAWKTTRVIPLYKGGDRLKLVSYRPISLCPVGSKILEKVVNSQVHIYLAANNLLPNTQFGFRTKHQTSHLLHRFLQVVIKALEEKKRIVCTFLDFSKAFDTVPHSPFIAKLPYYGFDADSAEWFRSYLSDRQQYVDFDGVFSDLQTITCGVPQGTCLGPLIFIIYLGDVSLVPKNSYMFSFADDTSLITIGETVADAAAKASTDYALLSEWYRHNRLSLNVGKTKFMILGNKNIQNPPPADQTPSSLSIQGEPIGHVTEYKLVGLVLDDKLNWQPQIEYIKRKLHYTYQMLQKIKYQVSTSSKLLLYNALFRSLFTYGLEHYASANKTRMDSLFILQKKVLRSVFCRSYRFHIESDMKTKKILTIQDEAIILRVMFAKHILHPTCPQHLKDILPLSPPSITRSSQAPMFLLHTPRTELTRKSSSFQIPNTWNNMDASLQNSSRTIIKNHIRNFLSEYYV